MHPSNIMRNHKSGESAQESGNKYYSPSFLPVVLHAGREDCLPLIWQLFGMRFAFLKIISVKISTIWQKYSNLYYMLHAKFSLLAILPTVRYEASLFKGTFYYTLGSAKLKGVYWFHLVRLSVCPFVDRIVFALYLLQYSLGPFHIYTSHQATSEGVSYVKFCSKWKKWKFWQILWTCNFDFVCFDLGSNMSWSILWIIIGRRGISSERRHSSCSGYHLFNNHFVIWYDVVWCDMMWCIFLLKHITTAALPGKCPTHCV